MVQSIRDGLRDECDMQTRLAASKLWLKAHGKMQPEQKGNMNITAEDVVVQILNQQQQVVEKEKEHGK